VTALNLLPHPGANALWAGMVNGQWFGEVAKQQIDFAFFSLSDAGRVEVHFLSLEGSFYQGQSVTNGGTSIYNQTEQYCMTCVGEVSPKLNRHLASTYLPTLCKVVM